MKIYKRNKQKTTVQTKQKYLKHVYSVFHFAVYPARHNG